MKVIVAKFRSIVFIKNSSNVSPSLKEIPRIVRDLFLPEMLLID